MKNKLIVTALILVATMCVSLMSGCWVDSSRIEFVEEPAKTYYVNAGADALTFVIRDMDTKEEIAYPSAAATAAGVSVAGFNTNVPGTFTATVTMGAYSIQFDYEVIGTETGFAGGNGSLADPYEIANPAHFQNMLDEGSKGTTYCYELISDIDMANVEYINQPTNFTGKINGNNYQVTNINTIYVGGKATARDTELFGEKLGNFELKNITIGFTASGDSACLGLITSVVDGANATFENVVTNGFIDAAKMTPSSMGIYVRQLGRVGEKTSTYTLKNCTNNVDIYNSSAITYVAGFIGQTYNPSASGVDLLMDNCDNHGDIEGASSTVAGIVNLRSVEFKNGVNSIKDNCENTGVIWNVGTGVNDTHQVVSYGGSCVYSGDFDELNESNSKGSLEKIDRGSIVKASDTSVTVNDITDKVKKLKIVITLSGTYVDSNNGGHLRSTQIIAANAVAGSQTITIPMTYLGFEGVAGYDKATAEAAAAAAGYTTVRLGLYNGALYFDYTYLFKSIGKQTVVMVFGLGENDKVVWATSSTCKVRE